MAHPRDFAGQDLWNHSFRNQDLTGATFCCADMPNTHFREAKLQQVNWEGVSDQQNPTVEG
ncbi:MAG: pentapeptide repeat-containing protein [Cyanophyceae cyanobacterium]